jgi:lysophospholipase L1-like esterase
MKSEIGVVVSIHLYFHKSLEFLKLIEMNIKPKILENSFFKRSRSFPQSSLVIVIFCISLISSSFCTAQKTWVGTWSCAPYAVASGNTPPAPYIANNTLRQIVRVSIGGDTLRVKFSNSTCATAVTMNKVNIAVQTSGSAIDASTIKQLKFNGNTAVTMSAKSTVTSDPIAFPLKPNMHLAITIYYGQAASSADMTGHVGSRTDSYILTGDQTASAAFSGAAITAHWYTINTIDVLVPSTAGCVAALGNSITDGYGLSGGLQNRWTDMLSQALLNNSATAQVGVLNLGIGGTNVAGNGATTGATRYQQDILNQSGVRWVIIFYGINDIGGGASATTIISAYQKMISDAHAKNIKVYGATITPVNGNAYFTAAHEAVRGAVNKWIRTPGNFDAFIDFDKTIRDPADTTKLQAIYSNDCLHPNAAGYKLLGESINLNLFVVNNVTNLSVAPTSINIAAAANSTGAFNVASNTSWNVSNNQSWLTVNPVSGSNNSTVTITAQQNTGSTARSATVTVSGSGVTAQNVTVTQATATIGGSTDVYLEAECGTIGSLWSVVSGSTSSNNTFVTIKSGNNSTANAPADATEKTDVTLDMAKYSTGIYFLKITNADQTTTEKIIKQ